ncbi:PREDICTED: uncharacterized protein LOC108361227 [Rhagoletis zephyria]|uniref:uncharacterized protein LOC108361227 n=1 Tax=Rhagoletis zephyria TaxID=28612 RepID=UPI00081133AA|nr:PREDICTED: uncharacterized protein LOC108361227 [Rhagoletis zephyria]
MDESSVEQSRGLPHPAIVAATTAAPIQRRNTGAQHQQPPESGASTGEHPNTPAPRLATPTTIGTNNNHGCYSSSHNYNTNNLGKHPGNQRARAPATAQRAVTPANRPRIGGTNRKSGNQQRQHQQPGAPERQRPRKERQHQLYRPTPAITTNQQSQQQQQPATHKPAATRYAD